MDTTTHWIRQAVIYHIYVRSFFDSNGDGIGDLRGLIEKLDYLYDGTERSLGINTIWLSPIYPSPMKDFGYDVADYENIDKLFGSLEDFDELIGEAHERGIKVLMDYIPNHTSSQHPWFKESCQSLTNPKRSWYIWRDAKPDGSLPNNWLSVFGGSAWELDPVTNQYYLHSFDKGQPDLNWRNPEVVEAMKKALRFWLDKGVDGFRVDAYDFLFKHADFLDEPANPEYLPTKQGPHDALLHVYSFSQPETLDMLKQISSVLEEYGQKFMVTEVYAKLDKLLGMYQQVGKEWFSPFNFNLILLPWSAKVHKEFIDAFDQQVGQLYLPTYVLGNHDQPRVVSRIGRAQARNAAILMLTLRGIPFIYYGDELGMTNAKIPADKVQDPFEIKSPGLGLGRDPERSPMQWSADMNAGFTKGDPWLPLNTDYADNNVESELDDPSSMWQLYHHLLLLRKMVPALQDGSYLSLPLTNPEVFAFSRNKDGQTIIVVLNYSNKPQKITLDFPKAIVLIDSLNKLTNTRITNFNLLKLAPNQGLVLGLE